MIVEGSAQDYVTEVGCRVQSYQQVNAQGVLIECITLSTEGVEDEREDAQEAA